MIWSGKLIVLVFCCAFFLGCQRQDSQSPESRKGVGAPIELREPIPITRPSECSTDWAMFMHDLRFSGKSPDRILKPPLKLSWKFKTGGPVYANPIVVAGIIYVGSTDGKLYALDAKRWGVKWTFQASDAIRYPAAVWNKFVYFSARDNRVYALDLETGELVWKFQSDNWMDSPPVVSNGQLYIGAFAQTIHVINAVSGKVEGKHYKRVRIEGIEYRCIQGQLRPEMPEHQADLWRRHTEYSYSYPVHANGVVYIGARDGRVRAIDASSKKEIWTYETAGFVDAAPAVSDGVLYVASHDGHVYAFDNQTSEVSSAQSEASQIGIVVRDHVPVYSRNDVDAAIGLHLNDGVQLRILTVDGGWYQVELPNGKTGWIFEDGIGIFEDRDGMQFNTLIASNSYMLDFIEGAEYPKWSPDGKTIAFFKRTNLSGQYWKASELWITSGQAKRNRKICEGRFYNPHLSWSFNSNLIAFEAREGNESDVWIFDLQTARLTRLVRGDAPVWSPIANQLAFRRWEEGVDVVYRINSDTTGLTPIVRIPIEGRVRSFSFLDPPSWSLDGQRIAIGLDHQHYKSGYARIRLQHINGTRLSEIPTQHQHVKQIGWSVDGTQLAYVLRGSVRPDALLDKRLHITEVNVGNKTRILKHTSPSWSPQGRYLAYLEREDCMGLDSKVWILDTETNQRCAVARTMIDLTAVVWHPDGTRIFLWHTSKYLRNGQYKPARTRGWSVEVQMPLTHRD